MLEFMRNKLVSVARRDAETLAVQAVLDDSIYSIEVDLDVRIADLKCLSIKGRWKRWTTPECPKALNFLDQAEGFCLTPEVDDQIHKVIGRTSCRHFANLLIECAYAVQEAVKLIQWQEKAASSPGISLAESISKEHGGKSGAATGPGSSETRAPGPAAESSEPVPPPPPRDLISSARKKPLTMEGDGFSVDLHLHTFPASRCASSRVEAMIEEAKRIGLDAICLTDHNHVWSRDQVNRLMDAHQFLIFRGNEIVTDQGDMLVFGMDTDVRNVIPLTRLKQQVDDAGGFIIAAHPFRGFLTFGAGQLGLTPEKAMQREMFTSVYAVEARNGKVTAQENSLALQVALGLNLPVTGGSDAHDISCVGIYATRFSKAVSNEEELITALKSGSYEPVEFRRTTMADSRAGDGSQG